MRKFIAGLVLALFAVPAMATITLTWVAPTQREDGTALLSTEIASYQVSYTLGGVAQTGFNVPGNVVTYAFADTVKGKYCFTMHTVDTDGLVSAPSATVCKNANPKAPGSPNAK